VAFCSSFGEDDCPNGQGSHGIARKMCGWE
jgi:hypothetical protein